MSGVSEDSGMAPDVRRQGDRVSVLGPMTIYCAAALRDALLGPLLQTQGAVQLDLSQVTEFDTAGMQLVLLARREAAQAHRVFEIVAASPVVAEALSLCDLDLRSPALARGGETS